MTSRTKVAVLRYCCVATDGNLTSTIAVDIRSYRAVLAHLQIPRRPNLRRGKNLCALSQLSSEKPQQHSPPSVHRPRGRSKKNKVNCAPKDSTHLVSTGIRTWLVTNVYLTQLFRCACLRAGILMLLQLWSSFWSCNCSSSSNQPSTQSRPTSTAI